VWALQRAQRWYILTLATPVFCTNFSLDDALRKNTEFVKLKTEAYNEFAARKNPPPARLTNESLEDYERRKSKARRKAKNDLSQLWALATIPEKVFRTLELVCR